MPDQFLLVFQEQWKITSRRLVEILRAERESRVGTEAGFTLTSAHYQKCLETVNAYMKELVHHRLGPQLLKIVDILIHRYPSGSVTNAEIDSTVLKNSVSVGVNHVALQFVKYICKILSLDTVLAAEVTGLRRTLLTQLNIKEFNSQSEFVDPSVSYVLRDVICSHCNTCKDVDLLRDPHLSGNVALDEDYRLSGSMVDPDDDHNDDAPLASPHWICNHCGTSYDVQEVEHRLLQDFQRLQTSFLLQDFRCIRTSSVSARFCSSQSEFCAPLRMDVLPGMMKSQLKVLQRVAEFHQFKWLSEALENVI